MKRKLLALLITMTLIFTSTISWAEILTPTITSNVGLTPDGIFSTVFRVNDAIYVTGLSNKASYLAKYDASLKQLWKLKTSDTISIADYYGGFIYGISEKSVYKIDPAGKLIWETKHTATHAGILPESIVIADNKLFFAGLINNNHTDYFFVGTSLYDLNGKHLASKKFTYATNYNYQAYYEQGFFYFDQGEEHYAKTTDNKTIASLGDETFRLWSEDDYRAEVDFEETYASDVTAPKGTKYYSSQIFKTSENLFLKSYLRDAVKLADNSLFGILLSGDYREKGFARTGKPKAVISQDKRPEFIPSATAYNSISNLETYTAASKTFVSGYNKDQYLISSANNVSSVFLERGLAKAEAISVTPGQALSASMLNLGNLDSATVQDAIASEMLNLNIYGFRSNTKHVMANLSDVNTTLKLESDLGDLPVYRLVIATPKVQLILDKNALKAIQKLGGVTVTFAEANGSYTVKMDQSLNTPYIVAIPATTGNTDTQTAVVDAKKNAGGKYNPVTGLLEVHTNTGGTFVAKQNAKTLTDLSTQSTEIKLAVNALVAKGLIAPKTDKTFAPDALMTNADMIYALKMMTGNPNFQISLDAKGNLTKEQLVNLMSTRLIEDTGYLLISDDPLDAREYKDIQLLASITNDNFSLAYQTNCLINYRDVYLDPKSTLTRGEAAQMIYEFYKYWW